MTSHSPSDPAHPTNQGLIGGHPAPNDLGPEGSTPPQALFAGLNGWGANVLAPAGALGNPPRLTAIGKPVGAELWWIGADGSVTGEWCEPGSPWAAYPLAGPGSAAPGEIGRAHV